MTATVLQKARSFAAAQSRRIATRRGVRAVERAYAALGPVASSADGPIILADGMWDNPNHFFRLRLFLQAVPEIARHKLVAILRRDTDRTRRTLEQLGFRTFLCRDALDASRFAGEADRLLAGARDHRDLLDLALPEGLPAYAFYDTALKQARHPQPQIGHPIWRQALAEQLRDIAFARSVFDGHPVAMTVLSHPWKSEFAALTWASLARGAPGFHLTGYCEAVRIRRFASVADYAAPAEHLGAADFDRLPAVVRAGLVAEGRAYLDARATGAHSDINARMAYRPELRVAERQAARAAVGGGERPIVLVASHVWYDYPHTFAMRNFTDFLDWMRLTIETARSVDAVTWVLKPHPTEAWYGGFRLADIAADLPPHVRLLPVAFDTATAQLAADAVVTAHGTMAIEAAARGRTVVAGDRSYYSGWGFTYEAGSRAEYVALLGRIATLAPPSREQRDRAAAFAALAFAPPPPDLGLLAPKCDSSGPVLCRDIVRTLAAADPALERERAAIARWLASGTGSYAVHNRIERLRSLGAQAVAAA